MSDEIVPGSFRLVTVKEKKLHPMTITDKFVTLFAFHHADMDEVITKGKDKGKTVTVRRRAPTIVIWDGKNISYNKAFAGDKIRIGQQDYIIDRVVDDIYKYLPTEEFITRVVEPDFKKEIKKFKAEDLFNEVFNYFEHYFWMESKMLYRIIALFSINQSVFDAYDSTPFLFIRSPLESCGKSNLGKSIQQMWNGILSTNIDAHHVFRLVHGCSPTFIIDENQDLDQRRKKDDRIKNLMSVINSGYQRGVGVIRFRERSGQFGNMIAETFDTYGPKVIIATKGRIPRDTQSRCVEIMMQRAPRGSEYPDYAARWDEANPRTEVPYRIEKLEKIREMMAIFRLKYGAEIKKISGKAKWRDELDHTGAFASLRNRDLEIFKPLIILCLKYKPEWTDLVAKYIREFVEMRAKTEHSEETTVLFALRRLWQLVEEGKGTHWLNEETQVSFDETEEDGQIMWVSASTIRYVIENYGVGSIEEFGRHVESKIGRILSEFGFVGTKRSNKGNLRKIKTSKLADRCINYMGVRLSGTNELSQQEKMESITRVLRREGEIDFDELLESFNGAISEKELKHILKKMRTEGTLAATSSDGKGRIIWNG